MIYLLYGEDTYRSWQKLQQIKAKYLDTSMGDTDFAILNGEDLSFHQFRQQVQTLPFLAKSRLVVVKNLMRSGKKEIQEDTVELLGSIPQTTILFFYEAGTPDRRSKLFQALNKPKQAQLFELLSGGPLVNYLIEEAKERGLVLRPGLANELIALLGADLWSLTQELEKLALYKMASAGAEKRVATEADIKLLVSGVLEAKAFDLLDAFGNRNATLATQLLRRLPDTESEHGLLALIASHYRNLLAVADGKRRGLGKDQLAKELKLHPFVVSKAISQVTHYTFRELMDCYRFLFELDLATKQSVIEPMTGLTVLATSISAKPIRLPSLTEESMVK